MDNNNTTSIDEIIQSWKKQLTKIIVNSYIYIIFFLLTGICVNFFIRSTIFNASFFILIFICAYVGWLGYKNAKKLVKEWHEEFLYPTQKLIRTIDMVSAQKLDLLPEEQSNSFTSDSHIKLLEVARGILEHQRFIDQVVDNMFEMMFLLNREILISNNCLFLDNQNHCIN